MAVITGCDVRELNRTFHSKYPHIALQRERDRSQMTLLRRLLLTVMNHANKNSDIKTIKIEKRTSKQPAATIPPEEPLAMQQMEMTA
jgi:hypothetical protein